MEVKKMNVLNALIPWFFALYFLVLFAERAQSLLRAGLDGNYRFFGTAFDGYVNLLAIASLVGTLVLLIVCNGNFWKSLATFTPLADYTMLTVTAGVLLLSGMVHTEYTIAPVQFISYGMLIVAMILQTVVAGQEASHPFFLWYSVIYLTVFSMAIPVVYHAAIPHAALFHVMEAVVSIALVVAFTVMLRQVFTGNGENLLLWVPILIAAVGDALVLLLRWQEEINWFVLFFLVLAVILFIVGKILFRTVR